MDGIKFSNRQNKIIELVKENAPITSEQLADRVGVTRAALRSDLSVLTMTGILEAKPKVGYIYSKKPSYSLLYDYIRNISVENIMSKPIVVDENTNIYDAVVNLFLNDVGTLFIENEGILTGAVSRKDFLKIAIGGTDMRKVPVGIIMTRMPNIIFVERKDSAYLAARKIIEHEVDSLPVVEKFKNDSKDKLKIVGKISKTNITRLFVKMGKNK
ncbi:MAG: helix-turn-helix transcriptional regulator [Clostridium sp.]|uniref:helix-turn-helix transcriptional regulator n=1 Tax=Clostridium sp. TaxID=1506 RepID=UPI0025C54D86|nr:helix-turn-helix transcriptional regulator [Clostridium sp.]MCH3964677.1 helix-turn-helix transcriptional regulator [Clostridium sp.]MCI1715148.1 helix-turn-helix transcriptional regulator [Clostridium sp.]MCI1799410.1 helix-turn-helix transcriptional regulator [Clostridium sp.]MCI1813331.1 helix-turn-helix transcriptional regulator [Clostridium sp.]MCI1870222.1 helix-turn-helix transcriptional regulator [Clostridium sp.]